MKVNFNCYGNEVSGYFPDSYAWCIPLFEASLEIQNGAPACPKFHCAGLRDQDYNVQVKTVRGNYKMQVTDAGTVFVPS